MSGDPVVFTGRLPLIAAIERAQSRASKDRPGGNKR
jgi:hypothetical protein